MSFFADSMDWVCGVETTDNLPECIDPKESSKSAMAALLRAMDYLPPPTRNDYIMPDESHQDIESHASSIDEARTGPEPPTRKNGQEKAQMEGSDAMKRKSCEILASPIVPGPVNDSKENPFKEDIGIDIINSMQSLVSASHAKTDSRRKELEKLRQMSLAKVNALKLENGEAPTDAATFMKQQRDQTSEQRRKERAAKEFLHAYRSDDNQLLEDIRRTMSKESATRRGVKYSHSAPVSFTAAEVDEFCRQQKDIASFRAIRVKSFEDSDVSAYHKKSVKILDETARLDVKTVQMMFDGKSDMENAVKKPPLPKSPSSPKNKTPVDPMGPHVKANALQVQVDPDAADHRVRSPCQTNDHVDTLHANEEATKSISEDENSDIQSIESTEAFKPSEKNEPSVLKNKVIETKDTVESCDEVQAGYEIMADTMYDESIHSLWKNTQITNPSEHEINGTTGTILVTDSEKEDIEDTPEDKLETTTTMSLPKSKISTQDPTSSIHKSFIVPPRVNTPGSLLSVTRSNQVSKPAFKNNNSLQGARKSLFEGESLPMNDKNGEVSVPVISCQEIQRMDTRPTCSSPALKRVPLYFRRPTAPTAQKVTSATCDAKYKPNLHKSRDGCERCLHWASPDERAKFEADGHHLRIMRVRGGCDRNCNIFPRNADECPVRLCKRCYFDTHRDQGLRKGEEEYYLN